MKSKWLFLCISLTSLALGVLPEFISEEMKNKAKSIFGNHYDAFWLIIFLSVGALFIYLTWKEVKLEKGNHAENTKLSTQSNKPAKYKNIQKHSGVGDNVAGDKIVGK